MQDVNDLWQHLIDMWAGAEQSITDDTIDQLCIISKAVSEPREDKLVKTLLTVIN